MVVGCNGGEPWKWWVSWSSRAAGIDEDLSISVLELSFAQWREWLYWLEVNNERPPSGLRVVMVGCEAIPVRLMRQWMAYDVELVHVFGLTETAITSSTWHSKDWDASLSGSLPSGSPLGNTRLHVLDAAQGLQPVGVAGELYIGGDGVTQGYLGRRELSEARFVELPWIDSGRLYRTGDKVRWREDGNIEFLGRMDNQVKIRGYRIEPGEIESRLRELPQVQDAVVLVRDDAGHDKQLVGYVVLEVQGGGSEVLSDIKAGLSRHLPGYMIPGHFLLLESLPLTLNGKVDKQALPAPGSQYLEQSEYVAPRNEVESTLCDIWSSALRVERVGIRDNFFELGGDSIISIQIASRASQAGISLSVRQLFEHQNIADVVANLDKRVGMDVFQGEVSGKQVLLPIHHWFFAEKQVRPSYNNMSLLLVPPVDVDERWLREWLYAIFQRHDALRLRFYESDGQWHSDYFPLQELSIDSAFTRVDMRGMDESARTACLGETGQELQESFSLSGGPLMKVGYFDADEAQDSRLLLVLHHAVVDGVSWRILLDDLSLAYEQHSRGERLLLGNKTTSYQRWAEALVEYGQSEAFEAEIGYWRRSLGADVPALPQDERVESELDVAVHQFKLDEAETEQLLRQSPAAYRTQVNELLLAAVWLGIYRWSGNSALRIWMEGHGREDIFESLDVTQTMGWFTTLYPLTLDVQAKYPGEIIKQVKEQYRALPNRGLGYGIARYLSPEIDLPDGGAVEVTFNYLGQFDQAVNSETAFQVGREFSGRNVAQGNPREALLNISGQVVSGSLVLGVDYDPGSYRAQTMEHLGRCIKESLLSLTARCCEPGAGGYTPSDFTLSKVSQLQLDQWQRRYRNIEDIYPTVPMQQGMLFHRLLDNEAGAYLGQITYRIRGPLTG
ncbi:AMP-binding protein [Paraneptunicella aestuarii]|nr:AMP-binding protein [Paraneptunicella aestuarii]